MLTLDGATAILNTPVPVPLDVHDRAKRILGRIRSNRSVTRARIAGSDADLLGFALQRTVGEDGTEVPVSSPSTAFSAFAVACGQHRFHDGIRFSWWLDTCTARQQHTDRHEWE